MKAQLREEPLVNTLARRVGGAAGFIAKAAHGLAANTGAAPDPRKVSNSKRRQTVSGRGSKPGSALRKKSQSRRARISPATSVHAVHANSNSAKKSPKRSGHGAERDAQGAQNKGAPQRAS